MKTLIMFLCILFSISCLEKQKETINTGEFDFLIGDWERTNTKPGITTMEHWIISKPSEYLGHGYTIEQKDTTFNERMRIIRKDTSWFLEVYGRNESPIRFNITEHNNISLLAENPAHDFPKRISYSYFDDTLSAQVANEEIEIPFIFWRVEK